MTHGADGLRVAALRRSHAVSEIRHTSRVKSRTMYNMRKYSREMRLKMLRDAANYAGPIAIAVGLHASR